LDEEIELEDIYSFKDGIPPIHRYKKGRIYFFLAHIGATLWALSYVIIYGLKGDLASGIVACIGLGAVTNLFIYGASFKANYLAPLVFDSESDTIYTAKYDIFLQSIIFIEFIRYKDLSPRDNIFVVVGFINKNNEPGLSISRGTDKFDGMKFCNYIKQLNGWPIQKYPIIVRGFWFSGHYRYKQDRMDYMWNFILTNGSSVQSLKTDF